MLRRVAVSTIGLSLLVACGDDGAAVAAGSSGGTGATSVAMTTSVADTTSTTAAVTSGASSSGGDSTGAPTVADPRGYLLISALPSRFSYLMDADGMEINRWESATTPANAAYMRPGGHMLRVSRDPDPPVVLVSGAGGVVEEFDWDGNVVWRYEHIGPGFVAHHDIEPLPNGHVIMVAYEMFSVDEAIAAGRTPANVPADGLWADYLVEVDPATDEIVWEWHVWDHLVQDADAGADNYGVVGDHPELIDINFLPPGPMPHRGWTHVNAVSYDPQHDQLVLSPRSFSEIWIIDHSTTSEEAAGHAGGDGGRGGDLLYRWGNPATYDAGGPADRDLYFQHSPRWIEPGKPGAGNLLVFDNGDANQRPYSRIVEIATPVQPDGSFPMEGGTWGPADPIVVYEAPRSFFAPNISSADRVADGATVICDGPGGEVFEIDADGQVQFGHALGGALFRAEHYEADDPAWDGLTAEQLAPGGPVVLDFS